MRISIIITDLLFFPNNPPTLLIRYRCETVPAERVWAARHAKKWSVYAEMSRWGFVPNSGLCRERACSFLSKRKTRDRRSWALEGEADATRSCCHCCARIYGMFTLRKLFATLHRYRNTRIDYAVYQVPLQEKRNGGFLIAETIVPSTALSYPVREAQWKATAVINQLLYLEGTSQQLCFKLLCCGS